MLNKDNLIITKIIHYCDDIADYIFGMNETDFQADSKTVAACAFCLGQIGELTKKVSEDKKASLPQIPWHKMYGLRNRIIHDYEGVNLSRLWYIVSIDIPALRVNLGG